MRCWTMLNQHALCMTRDSTVLKNSKLPLPHVGSHNCMLDRSQYTAYKDWQIPDLFKFGEADSALLPETILLFSGKVGVSGWDHI